MFKKYQMADFFSVMVHKILLASAHGPFPDF